jgi:membrane associated rhomboid family serine protease
MSFKNDIQIALKGTYRSVWIFLIANVSVFLIANILIHVVKLAGDKITTSELIAEYLCMPSGISHFFARFWTIGSYMFMHVDLRHILSNMLWLWFLGRIFCELLGSKRMVFVYLMGGIAGGIVYLIISAAIGDNNSILYGASGAVMAIVVAVATHAPDYRVYPFGIPMKLKWLALISFLLTTAIDFSSNTGGKAAHLGGAIFGMMWAFNHKRGNIFAGMFQRKSKLNVAHRRTVGDLDYNAQKNAIRKRVDEILDKISRSGYDSLSRDEKDFLQKNHDKF